MHIRTQWRSKGGTLDSGGILLMKIKFGKEFKISNSALLLLNKFQTVYLISVILL